MNYKHQVTAWDTTGKPLVLCKEFPSAAPMFSFIFSLPWYVRYHYEVLEKLENSEDWVVFSAKAGIGGPK